MPKAPSSLVEPQMQDKRGSVIIPPESRKNSLLKVRKGSRGELRDLDYYQHGLRTPKKLSLRFKTNLVNQGLTQAHKISLRRHKQSESLSLNNDPSKLSHRDAAVKAWDLSSAKH